MLTRVVYLSALASLAAAHGLITAVQGGNGITGTGMGVDPSTPRNGVTAKPFQRDTSIIRDSEIIAGKVGPCGRTKQKGAIDLDAELAAASAAGLPSLSPDGELKMTLHQVNQDGAGPYTCDVSPDGGKTFMGATVTSNIFGIPLVGLSLAAAKDFPLNVKMPSGIKCAGGPNGNACIMRCRNTTPAGPFGSCVAFTDGEATQGPISGSPTSQKSSGTSPQALTPAAAVGAVPAAIADAIPPIIPDIAATLLNAPAKLAGINRAAPLDTVNPASIVPAALGNAIPPIVSEISATTPESINKFVKGSLKNPLAGASAIPAGLADSLPPAVPDAAAAILNAGSKIVGINRAYPASKRALASPEVFAAQDANDTELEEKLIVDFLKGKTGEKRMIKSRIVGSLRGQWI